MKQLNELTIRYTLFSEESSKIYASKLYRCKFSYKSFDFNQLVDIPTGITVNFQVYSGAVNSPLVFSTLNFPYLPRNLAN